MVGTFAIVALLAFVVFPARKLTVDADGKAVVVVSRHDDVAAVLESAGVARGRGDVVVLHGAQIAVERALPVLIAVDGQTLSWRTRAPNVEALLGELDLVVGPYDLVLYNGHPVNMHEAVVGTPPLLAALDARGVAPVSSTTNALLEVRRAVPITVVEDGREINLHSTATTLGDALREAGIKLGPADRVYPSPSTPVRAGMHVSIDHATTFTLQIGSISRTFFTHQTTLEDALAEVGLTFGPEDRVEPPLTAVVSDGLQARVIRVTGRPFLETEVIPHITVFEPDDTLHGTQTRRITGSDGVLVTEYRIVIEDGVEVEKTFVKQYQDPEPRNTVIYYAASALNSTTFAPADHQVTKVMRMWGTWYNAASSGKPATHPAYGITRSGVPLTKGIVAVDMSVIPLGTRLYVPGYGFAIAGDTGGGIIGDMIDMGYPDGVEVDWITGWTDVYILTP